MIKDAEMRDLYRIESGERLRDIENSVLALEANPAEPAPLEPLLRDIHSLKGASRMLEVTAVERIAHAMEDYLAPVRKGEAALTKNMADTIYNSLDAVKRLVREAVTGEESGVDIPAVVHSLIGDAPGQVESSTNAPATGGASGSQSRGEPLYQMDTVRVKTDKLDSLLTHSGELVVLKTRMAHRLVQAEEAMGLCDELAKERQDGNGVIRRLSAAISELRDAINEDESKLEFISSEMENGIRNIRLVPFHVLFDLFPRMTRDLAAARGVETLLLIEGGDTKADKKVIEEMKDPIMHLIRNAIDHGIEPPDERERAGKPRAGTITLSAQRTETSVEIRVADDGRGLDTETIKQAAIKRKMISAELAGALTGPDIQALIFASGFSTSAFATDISGRGIGLDAVRVITESLKGSIHIESTPGAGCVMRIKLPVTLSATRALIVMSEGRRYAIPIEFTKSARMVSRGDVFPVEGRDTIVVDGAPVAITGLLEILEMPAAGVKSSRNGQAPRNGSFPCVTLFAGDQTAAVRVDELLDELEITLKPRCSLLKRVRNISGSTILGNGEVCAVLNPPDVIRTVRKRSMPKGAAVAADSSNVAERKRAVLVVEDSITTRTQLKRIITGAGYDVVTAVDGMDACEKMAASSFDAVVSDVMMPKMNGLALTARIRADQRSKDLPVILVTTLASDADKKKGLEAGANAYIPKPAFDQKLLLETLRRFI
ncbi:MAG: response regulator [Nitrospinae bacterium]|nr:response regulator [Nitrospinota bacterium]